MENINSTSLLGNPSLGSNQKGHLTIGGADTVELAQRYGTPLYVMDEGQIRAACRSYQQSIQQNYGGNGRAYYASKAFCCKEICRIMQQEGMGLDVVSGGELYTALSAGFPAERICFHGNYKTREELEYALSCGVGSIVVDSRWELGLLQELAARAGKRAEVFLRIKPSVEAHTHKFVQTGQIDSKFGVALVTGEAMELVQEALGMENIHLAGVHCHIGSQIFDVAPFELAAQRMLRFMDEVYRRTGHLIRQLDLGGGFGIRYTQEDQPAPYGQYMEQVAGGVKRVCGELGFPMPFISIEPGRSIVGQAGITLYRVGPIKEIPQVRTYAAVDGGMTDNPRYALYQSRYQAVSAENAGAPRDRAVTLAGRCCESGDLLGEGMELSRLHSGELVAVLCTGAYNYSMASNYNRLPRPAVVMVRDGESRVIVERESYEDLVRNDR